MVKLGFIGYGFVGKACHTAFKYNCEAVIIDPKYSILTVEDLVVENPAVTFVCLNAPTLEDRTVDASIIYTVFNQLAQAQYKGIVVLKSTLPPDIVYDLYEQYGKSSMMNKYGPLRYVYSPEFLRESQWEKDALSPTMIIVSGDYHDYNEVEIIYHRHSHIKGLRFRELDYKEAALAKYSINAFLASKVVFMNQVHQLYKDMYDKDEIHREVWEYFTEVIGTDIRIGTSHMDVPGPDGQYGYGGSCFPKDVSAMIGFDTKERMSLLREAEVANTKIRLQSSVDSSKEI